MQYVTTIGLEVHVQLKTRSKMFCACPVEFGAEPNSHTCPTCLGVRGALPVMNHEALRMTVLTGLMLDCEIAPTSKFDRKNYFYPDMPKNYQISQYDMPFTSGGVVPFWLAAGTAEGVKLRCDHLEEDTGKSMHAGSADGRLAGSTHSLVDFNRAGVPLMECVSEPDIRSAAE